MQTSARPQNKSGSNSQNDVNGEQALAQAIRHIFRGPDNK